MKKTYRIPAALFTLTFIFSILAGCGKQPENTYTVCPFSPLDWEATYEDMTALEGTDYESYDSVYYGTTYTYPKEYLGENGTIKYMFDDKNELMCMAWSCNTGSISKLDSIYSTIHEQVVEKHGESGFDNANSTNYGDVWYLESGDILITAVTTESETALQYGYLNPEVSNTEVRK